MFLYYIHSLSLMFHLISCFFFVILTQIFFFSLPRYKIFAYVINLHVIFHPMGVCLLVTKLCSLLFLQTFIFFFSTCWLRKVIEKRRDKTFNRTSCLHQLKHNVFKKAFCCSVGDENNLRKLSIAFKMLLLQKSKRKHHKKSKCTRSRRSVFAHCSDFIQAERISRVITFPMSRTALIKKTLDGISVVRREKDASQAARRRENKLEKHLICHSCENSKPFLLHSHKLTNIKSIWRGVVF